MMTNDPDNIRLTASKDLSRGLISNNDATNGKVPDLVTVVDFATDANLLYPLGDPASVQSSIDSITPRGGTAIGAGIETAINELTKSGHDPTTNRTGIVVFTDGQDSLASGTNVTIEEIKRAFGLGIRVSFGFLSVDSSNQDREILGAILTTGGIYATVGQASAQQSFVALTLVHGLTGIDASGVNDSSVLLPGLASAAFLSQTGSNTFTYTAKAGETINITVTAIDQIDLKVALREVNADTEIKSNTTGGAGVAFLEYNAISDTNVEVVITATNISNTGIFSIGLNSSIPFNDNCNISRNASTTQPASPPSSSSPAIFTGEAVSVPYSALSLFTPVSVFFFGVVALLM